MGSIISIDDRLGIIDKWNPRKAEQLRFAWLLEDDEGKKDVRWYIDNLAEIVLLDPGYRNSTFLSVIPEEKSINGDIEIGNVMRGRSPVYPLKIKTRSLLRHLGIFGSTGSGKTNALYNIINGISKNNIPVLVFDFSKKNYRDLLETGLNDKINVFTVGKNTAPFRFNPLIPPDGILPSVWTKRFAEIFDHAYWLLGGGRYVVLKALEDLYYRCGAYSNSNRYPAISEVRDWVKSYETRRLTFREKNWVSTAKRALDSLCSRETGDMFVREGIKPHQLLNGITVLELDGLNEENRIFFIEILLQWLRDWLLNNWKKEETAGVIVLEEAHHVLNREKSRKIGSETVVDLLFREIRELGMGIVYADQHPSKISYSALGNTDMQVYMRLNMDSKHDSDVVDASRMLGLRNDEVDYLRNLDVGCGIVKSSKFNRPFSIRFPWIPVQKSAVTDGKLKKVMEDRLTVFYGDGYLNDEEREEIDLSELDLKVVRALGSGMAVSKTELMCYLNTSAKVLGGRMHVLINNGYVRYRTARVYRNKVCYYFLSVKGAKLFRRLTGGKEVKPDAPETLHKQMKDYVIEKYTSPEGGCVLEDNNTGNGYADVVLERDGRIAKIEIETGANSDGWIYHNIDKCLRVRGATYFLCASQRVKNRVIQQAARYSLDNKKDFRIFALVFRRLKELKKGGRWKRVEFGSES